VRGRELRAIDQGEPFFRAQRDRGESRCRECLRAGLSLALIDCFAFTDHHGGHMRERSEITGRTDRSLSRDDRDHTGGDHSFKQFHQFRANTGCAAPE